MTRRHQGLAALAAVALAISAVQAVPATKFGHAGKFVLPSAFEGTWVGVPKTSAVGPFSNPLMFSIAQASNGDYLFEQNLHYDHDSLSGWQRFYVEGDTGVLWYCGRLEHFRPAGPADAGRYRIDAFSLHEQTATSVTFCLDNSDPRSLHGPWPYDVAPHCSGCSCGEWKLSLGASGSDDAPTLTSSVVMGGSPQHLLVSMKRRGPAPAVPFAMPGHGSNFTCDFAPGGRDASPVHNVVALAPPTDRAHGHTVGAGGGAAGGRGCPYHEFAPSPERDPAAAATAAGYANCERVNEATGFTLAWTVNGDQVDVAVSARVSASQYVALGFRPASLLHDEHMQALGTGDERRFGMQGADIVVGSSSWKDDGYVKTMYAAVFAGAPEPSDDLVVSNATVSLSADGSVSTMRFTRPLVSGHLHKHSVDVPITAASCDFIWAVGPAQANGTPGYHGDTRGFRMVLWGRSPANNCA